MCRACACGPEQRQALPAPCIYRVGDRPQASSWLSQQEELVCPGACGAGVGPTHSCCAGRSLRLRGLTGDLKNEGARSVKPRGRSMSEMGGEGSGLGKERKRGPGVARGGSGEW